MILAAAPLLRRRVRRDTGCCCETFAGFDTESERAISRTVRRACCPIHGREATT